MASIPYFIPVLETVAIAWQKIKGSKSPIWAAIGIGFLIMLACSLVGVVAKSLHPIFYEMVELFSRIIGFLLQLGFMYMGIRQAFNLSLTFNHVFRAFERNILWRALGVYVLKLLIFAPLGLLIFGFPAWLGPLGFIFSFLLGLLFLFLSIRLTFAVYFVLDKGAISPWLAIKSSYIMTTGNVWRLIALFFIQIFSLLFGMLLLLIGLIWAIPFSLILFGVAYQELTANTTNNIPNKI